MLYEGAYQQRGYQCTVMAMYFDVVWQVLQKGSVGGYVASPGRTALEEAALPETQLAAPSVLR